MGIAGLMMSLIVAAAGAQASDPEPSMTQPTRLAMMEDDMDMPMKDATPDPSMPSGGMQMEKKGMKPMEAMRSKMGDTEMMGMGAMGGMNSPAAMATPSALPGFPGQSHLYHLGATDFFLDHPGHVILTTQQQKTLAQRKQQSLLKQGDSQRQIDAVEHM